MIDERVLHAKERGKVTISVDGSPVLSLDGDTKSLDLEISGLKKTNIRISNILETKSGGGRILLRSTEAARRIVKNGWRFSLYDRGERLLTTSNIPRLGPYLRFNPLRLKRILGAL